MKLFEVKDKKVEINLNILVVPELLALLNHESRHTGKGFDPYSIGYRAINYLGLYYDFDSPYQNLAPENRKNEIRRVCFELVERKTQKSRVDELFEHEVFKKAENKIKQLIQSPEDRILQSMLDKIDEINIEYEKTPATKENWDILFKAMERMKENQKVISELRKKQLDNSENFGKRELSLLEEKMNDFKDDQVEKHE